MIGGGREGEGGRERGVGKGRREEEKGREKEEGRQGSRKGSRTGGGEQLKMGMCSVYRSWLVQQLTVVCVTSS